MRSRSWAVLVAFAVMACSRNEAPSEPPIPERPRGAASSQTHADSGPSETEAASAAAASAVASAVTALRERSLPIEPRGEPSARIAFGKGRVARLGDEVLVVHSADGQLVLKAPVQSGRALFELADGSLAAADRSHLYVLPAGATKLETKPRVTLFFDSVLLPDLRTARKFWVMYPARPALYHYDLTKESGSMLMFDEFEEFGQKIGVDRVSTVVGLKDGSFAVAGEDGKRIWRVYGTGKAVAMQLPEPERPVRRLLRAARLDRMWVVRRDGKADLMAMGPRLRKLRQVALDPPPFDVASSDANLAVVHLAQGAGKGKRFSLAVYDPKGKVVLERALPKPTGFSSGEDWVARVTRDEAVMLSAHDPLVAVGGPGHLRVWNLKSGKIVLEE